MTITATAQVLFDGPRNLVMQLTALCDGIEGGQETNVVKVDVSELDPPCDFVRINRIDYDVAGGKVQLAWDALDPVPFAFLDQSDAITYDRAPLNNPKPLGATGDILLSTVGFEANSSYTILLEMRKKFA